MTPDAVKDQTYFLAHLSQQQLARTIFPLGRLTKVSPLVDESLYMPHSRIGSDHHARLDRDLSEDSASQGRLAMTPDAVKDQTCFLARLSQQQLSRTNFSLGLLTKGAHLPKCSVCAGD